MKDGTEQCRHDARSYKSQLVAVICGGHCRDDIADAFEHFLQSTHALPIARKLAEGSHDDGQSIIIYYAPDNPIVVAVDEGLHDVQEPDGGGISFRYVRTTGYAII